MIDLEKQLLELGLTQVWIEENKPNNIWVKIYFNWKDVRRGITKQGHHQFSNLKSKEDAFNKIKKFIDSNMYMDEMRYQIVLKK